MYLFRLCWVFSGVHGLSLVGAGKGYSLVVCGLLLLRSLGPRAQPQELWHVDIVALWCGIFLGQRANPCALHWQADS